MSIAGQVSTITRCNIIYGITHTFPKALFLCKNFKNRIMQEQTFQLLLNGVPYIVKATPFEFNGDKRFTISYNGSDDFVFTYDRTVGHYVAIGDDSDTVPADLEVAIAERLYALV